jgi:tRNA (mo5U34)-methyltransferase
MNFISIECEELFLDYMNPNNPFGQKKDKRIENWIGLLSKTPSLEDAKSDFLSGVTIKGRCNGSDEEAIENLLFELLPWRKGPFKINNIFIDSEWRSNLKWDRFLELDLDLKGKTILDVGSGNGYYAFRMLGLEAEAILCLEPNLTHFSQFLAINHFIKANKIRMLPEKLEDLEMKETHFDVVFSMGLLYHQRDPSKHLNSLRNRMKEGGQLVIETIVASNEYGDYLEPKGNYASMPNVHFVHTNKGFMDLAEKEGLKVINNSKEEQTTLNEQRQTKWMPFKSYESAVLETDQDITVENFPAPKRKFYVLEKFS